MVVGVDGPSGPGLSVSKAAVSQMISARGSAEASRSYAGDPASASVGAATSRRDDEPRRPPSGHPETHRLRVCEVVHEVCRGRPV